MSEIKFTLSENTNIIKTVRQDVDEKNLVDSIQVFQAEVNACLTKIIDDLGDDAGGGGDCSIEDEDGDSEEEDHCTPKKKKNS